MQYGDTKIDVEELERYLGFDPVNENVTKPELPELLSVTPNNILTHVEQREADLVHFWHKVNCFLFSTCPCVLLANGFPN